MLKRTVLAAAVLAAGAAGAHAADAVCKLVKGDVWLKSGATGTPYKAHKGNPLYFGAEVRTGAGAQAHIQFTDGATLLVKENSTLSLQGTRKNTRVHFDVGEFLIGLKKKLGPDRKFQVRTPAAAAAVRGTLFWGLSDANKDTTYACFSDRIDIEAQGKVVTLEKGQTVKIPFGQAPGEPAPANVPLSYLDTFNVDGSIQELDALAK
jgi:hypothetical protein